MRGKAPVIPVSVCVGGITPAYAGKSSTPTLHILIRRDHPRLCGEKLVLVGVVERFQGSPPPMRGKVRKYFWFFHARRITPAYAGKRPLFVY